MSLTVYMAGVATFRATLDITRFVRELSEDAIKNGRNPNFTVLVNEICGEVLIQNQRTINTLKEYRREFPKRGVDLNKTLDQNFSDSSFMNFKKRAIIKQFQNDAQMMVDNIDLCFREFISIARCYSMTNDTDNLVSFDNALDQVNERQRVIENNKTVGEILNTLISDGEALDIEINRIISP